MDTKPGTSPASVPVAAIEHDYSKLERFVEDHKKSLLFALVVVLLVISTFFIYQFFRYKGESDAARAFTSAGTVDALRKTAADFPGKVAAGSALLELADRLWAEEKPAESREALQTFLSSYSSHPRYHAAYLALALQCQAAGDFDEADENLRRAMGSEVPPDIDQLARIQLAGLWVARAVHARDSGDSEAVAQFVREAASSYDQLAAGPLSPYHEAMIEDQRLRLNLIAPGALGDEEEEETEAARAEESGTAPQSPEPATAPLQPAAGEPVPEDAEAAESPLETPLPPEPESDAPPAAEETSPVEPGANPAVSTEH
ncbi:MAG TPA: tetratricopeptide repeat protein [Verrucomicrobiales bacterium]|nr:tetratricopeptide repeat protein [Verrucomicrobiales bacterium]